MAMDITLDFNNMMADRVGPQGIKPSEIEGLHKTLKETFRGLEDLRRLGQMPHRELPYQEDQLERIARRAAEIRSSSKTVLLLGTGGSSLGAACLIGALSEEGCRVELCEDLQPLNWHRISKELGPRETFLVAVSKSGKTVETLAAFLYFRQWMIDALGEVGYRRRVLFITDPRQGPLQQIAKSEKIETFPVPPGVGGRYSVLSTVGLLPAACAGIDVASLLAGARRMDERCRRDDVWFNPAVMSATLHFLLERKRGKKIRVVMPYEDRLRDYTRWFAQLWAESLGKRLTLKGGEVFAGSTPVGAFGSVDQHSQLQLYLEGPRDKTVTLIAVEKPPVDLKVPEAYAERTEFAVLGGRTAHELLTTLRQATEAALTEAGCPNQTLFVREVSPHALGQLLYMAEVETIFAGALYNINPFDQPGVETIKRYIRGLLGEKEFREYRQTIENAKKDRRYLV